MFVAFSVETLVEGEVEGMHFETETLSGLNLIIMEF